LSGAEFWRIKTPQGPLVLRRWPREHPTPQRLRFIHAVLEHAQQCGLAVLPVPIHADDGNSFVVVEEHLWELTKWLPGSADYAESSSDAKLRSAMVCLAEFHQATVDFPPDVPNKAPSPGVAKRASRIKLFAADEAALRQLIGQSSRAELATLARELSAAAVECAPAAVKLLEPLANVAVKLQPCIRDVWHENVLFEGDAVTGLVDFGAVDWESPAIDVARLLGSMAGNDSAQWQNGLAAYETIRMLSPQELQLIVALDAGGTVVGSANWLQWLYIDQRSFDDDAKVVGRMRELLGRLQHFRAHGSPAECHG
jgi:homoserine kinase type II